MDYTTLANELDTDPLTRGYSGMTDLEAADDLNTVYRNRNKTSISGSEAFNLTDETEYNALTDTQKNQWLALCAIDNHDPFGPSANVVVELFGGGSTTTTTLQAYRVETVSRATELGLGTVTEGDIQKARSGNYDG